MLLGVGLGVLHDDNVALAASFGGVAALLFADFGGTPRERATAYATLAALGATMLALGTVVSGSAVASVVTTVVVVALVRFSGNLGPRWGAMVSSTILALVLGILVPASDAAIPGRAGGWVGALALAALLSVVVLPRRTTVRVVGIAADAADGLADALRTAVGSVDPAAHADALGRTGAALEALRPAAVMPVRPAGPGAADMARRVIVDRLAGVGRVMATALTESPGELAPEMQALGNRAADALAAAAAALRDRRRTGDLAAAASGIVAARQATFDRVDRLVESTTDPNALVGRVDSAFVARAAGWYAETVVANVAFLTARREDVGSDRTAVPSRDARERWRRLDRFVDIHIVPQSVWFRDAARGGVALGLAVFLAQFLAVGHAFWVALGTLSVLRGSALATGQDGVRAAVGTGVGFGLSSLVLAGIGVHHGWLWVILVVAGFLVAYLPTVAGFLWGQAAFTVFVVVLFNLVTPEGWHTGLVRLEDIGLGVAVSMGVALLFWPRRIEPLVAQLVATVSGAAGALLVAAVESPDDRPGWDMRREAAVVAELRARAALVELMVQQRGRPAATEPWVARLNTASARPVGR